MPAWSWRKPSPRRRRTASSSDADGDAITGTLAFSHPQGGRVQVSISSGVVSGDSVTFSGQTNFPMGAIELTFHGKVKDTNLNGTADMTLRALLLGAETNPASLNLTRQ